MSIRLQVLQPVFLERLAMFLLAWWLMLTGNAEGPVTLFERIYIGYSFTPMGSIIGARLGNCWSTFCMVI